jgi:hypothetical protein
MFGRQKSTPPIAVRYKSGDVSLVEP